MNMMVGSLRTPSIAHKDVNNKRQTKKIPYMNEFLNSLQWFIIKVVGVRPVGNCGYRTIAALLDQGEESLALVQHYLIQEL